MTNFNKARSVAQKGFTLVELLIVLALLGLFAAKLVADYRGDKAKAQTMLTNMGALADAAIRMKFDTGCYPAKLKVLVDSEEALTQAASNSCNKNLSATWSGPYLNKTPVNTDGTFKADEITGEAFYDFKPTTIGAKTYYAMRANGIDAEVLKEAMRICNKAPVNGTETFVDFRCIATGLTATSTGTSIPFQVLITENR